MPGTNLGGIFSLRTIPDSRQIKAWIEQRKAKRAVVVGGGYIGMEMTENLVNLGLAVTIVEMQPHAMPLLDSEMVSPIHAELVKHGVTLRLNETVTGFEQNKDGSILAGLKSGQTEKADIVILSIGVRPEIKLAEEAGLKIGQRGGIHVDKQMRTSDEKIWAVGDAVEVKDVVTGQLGVIPLAGPANRQGRIAADTIMGRNSEFRGVQGTSVVGIMGLVVAFTGANEKTLRNMEIWDKPVPLDELRNRMGEVPKDQEIWAYFAVGQRSYYASRALSQYGYDINNLSGGFKTFTLKEALEFI